MAAALLPSSAWAEKDESTRPYFNEKSAPENLKDLLEIQEVLRDSLPRARKATVCIDMGGGSGSGVIVSKEGLILTAAHVSGGVGKKLKVILEDGTEYKAVSLGLVARTDAAMMKIDEEEKREYPFVDLDEKDTAKLGDWVFSLGHSGGFDKERGVGVRLGRLIRIADETINSDCALIGGDSGGPLFDIQGRLIGIHSRVGQTLEQNMHVPVREFLKNWEEMEKNEFIGEGPFAQKPVGYLGVGTEDHEGDGVKVTVVGEDTPAAKAGIKVEDIILEVAGKKIEDKAMFSGEIRTHQPGAKVKLKILRDEKEIEVEVELGKK